MKFGDIDSTVVGFGTTSPPDEQRDCWKYLTIKGSITFSKGNGGFVPMENPTGGKVIFKYKVTTECVCIAKLISGWPAHAVPQWDEGGTATVGDCEPDGSRKFEYRRHEFIFANCRKEYGEKQKIKCTEEKTVKKGTKEYTFDEFLTQTTLGGMGDEDPPTNSGDSPETSGPFLGWLGSQNAGESNCGREFAYGDSPPVFTDGISYGDPNRCEVWFKTLQDATVKCGAAEEAPLPVPPGAPPGITSSWPARSTFVPDTLDRGEGAKEMAAFQKCLLDDLMCPDSDPDVVQAFLNAFLSGNLGNDSPGGSPIDDGPLDDHENASCILWINQ